jgi:S-layer family protein
MSIQGSTPEGRRWLRRRGRLVIAGTVAALAIAAVPAAWATFTDVPPSNPFYADINALQGAGITQGCGGGNFCPTQNIQRQGEAAFVHRAAGRVALASFPQRALPTVINTQPLGWSTNLTAGAVSGNGFIKADAMMEIFPAGAGCPCQIDFKIWIDGVAASGWFTEATASNTESVMVPLTGVRAVGPGVHAISIRGHRSTGTATPTILAELSAIYAPFGSGGAGTLGDTGAAGATGNTNG